VSNCYHEAHKGIIMDKTQVSVSNTLLMGIQVRTHYQSELNPLTSKIGPCIQRYWQEGIANQLVNRVNPGRLFAVYTDYESDQTGGYTYFLGEEVSSIDNIPEGLSTITLPYGTYTRFTTQPAPLPHVIIDAWYNIWQMTSEDIGGMRTFHSDFEIYDDRAANPMAAIVDIYVGIE
jgi:predicted transcriptional regulator YdeE